VTFKRERGRSYDGRWWEYQANRMIGSLLLPSPLVSLALEELCEKTPVTQQLRIPESRRLRAQALVADLFQVNPIVAEIRLQELFLRETRQQEF